MLEHGGLSPGFLVGGVPENFGISARLSETPFFVIEADEYDTAFFDKRSKFVHYRPRTAILNNLEFDHADIFADLAAIETQFHHLIRTVPGNGLIVSNGSDANLERVLARGCWTPIELFAVTGAAEGWQAGTRYSDGFDVMFNGTMQGRVQWDLLGEHNVANVLAAVAAARHAGVPAKVAIEAMATFKNVKRRMETKGIAGGVTVYDDFAHHPTAIATTIAGLRAKIGGARLIAVLEPRSNTMKQGALKDQLAGSLADADMVFCYSAGLGWDAGAVLAPLRAKVTVDGEFDSLLTGIVSAVRAGDHVLIMSNGGFNGIHDKLLKMLTR
jgi:UDP-N-acetylmuramate: L-alanyl-gamma-D-glutamyl-meso-diaminopimelate ligase